jgi:hypothetical protein
MEVQQTSSIEIAGMIEVEPEEEVEDGVEVRTVVGEEEVREGPLCNHGMSQKVHHRRAWFSLHQGYHFLLQLRIQMQSRSRTPMPLQKS